MGAGLVSALFVSSIATTWLIVVLNIIGTDGIGAFAPFGGFGYFAGIMVEYSPYGGFAYLVHVGSICLWPRIGIKTRCAIYTLCGAMIGVSFLRVQIGLSGVTFSHLGYGSIHILVILGALTALTTYAIHGVLLYGVKRFFVKMEQ